jgi:branched-chain amino acid transport system substrate-binding protein
MHGHTFSTIVGDITFGADGEWTEARPIWVQYHGVKGHGLDQFKEPGTVTILEPEKYKTGDVIWPYTKARSE